MRSFPIASLFVTIASSATAAQATEATYTCSDGRHLTAIFSPIDASPGQVTLRFVDPEVEMVLPQALSADGGRYADEQTEFWIKGKGATLTRDGKAVTCETE